MLEQIRSSRYMSSDFPFTILRVIHDAGNIPKPHSHEFIELVFVEGGRARHLFEGESYELTAGNVFIINPGESHTFQIQPDGHLQIINCLFEPHLIQDSTLRELNVSESMDYFYIHPFLNPKERFHHLLRLQGDQTLRVLSVFEAMMEELVEQGIGYQTLIRLRMIEVLVLLSRYYNSAMNCRRMKVTDNHRLIVRRICGYLERHHQRKITLDTLATLFNISTRQLNRIFREELGVSVVEKIHQIRIEKAKHLLTMTDEKVITISTMVGYHDPAFFSRLFAREVGCAPGQYRDHPNVQ